MNLLKCSLIITLFLLSGCGYFKSKDKEIKDPPQIISYQAISGIAKYQDFIYNSDGFTGAKPLKAIRFALVDLINEQNDEIVQSAYLDEAGAFSFEDVSTGSYSIRIAAKIVQNQSTILTVQNLSNLIYSLTEAVEIVDQDIAVSLVASEQLLGGVFNLLDVFSAALEVFKAATNQSVDFEPLNIFWATNNTQKGTYTCEEYSANYCENGAGIYVIGGVRARGEDTDEYDDDVLWHEMGHYLENNLNAASALGGAHSFNDNTLDLRLAWSEGLSDYMAYYMRSTLEQNNSLVPSYDTTGSSIYVDSQGYNSVFINVDIANPVSNKQVYSSNEIAVAHVLYNLEPLNIDYELFTTLQNIGINQENPVNLETYWSYWISNKSSNEIDQAQLIFKQRLINYFEDSFEVDEQADLVTAIGCVSATVCYDQQHTQYLDSGELDLDTIKLNVSTDYRYTIETYGLSNGADTFLMIEDEAGSDIAIVSGDLDDAYNSEPFINNSYGYASKVVIEPNYTGVVTVKVRTPDEPYLFTGYLGTYSLRVTAESKI